MRFLRQIIIVCLLAMSYALAFGHHPISNALQKLFEKGDLQEAKEAISKYSVSELAALPDSTLFDYYYLKAFIKDSEGDEVHKQLYLTEAKNICEKSLGIHSPVYLEICWALGKSHAEAGDLVQAFEIYQAALIQSIGLYSLQDEDVKWQYEDINNKVIEWYKNDSIRSAMIDHRPFLASREVSKDAVQNDMEFYVQYYKDEQAKELLSEADKYNDSGSWENAIDLYLRVANSTQDNPIAKATLQELAAMNYINLEDFQKAEELLLDNLELLNSNRESKVYRRTLSQLSNLYSALHNYSKAKDYASQAKFSYEQALDFSRGYVLCLHRCATLERGNTNYFLALLLEDVALQELYRNNTFGNISGSAASRQGFMANSLSSASVHYNQVGFRKDATTQLMKAIEIAERNDLDASTFYANLADIHIAMKEFDKAVAAKKKAYELSNSDNDKIEIGTGLCLTQFLARQPISENVVAECSIYLQSFIDNAFSYATMDERRNFWSYFEYHFPMLNFLAYQTGNRKLNGDIYDNILVEKGLLLRTANSLRNQILTTGSMEDIQKFDHLLQLRALIPSLPQDKVGSVKSEIEKLDKEMTKKFSSYASYSDSQGVTWQKVRNHLGEGDIAIEFYNIPEVTWHEDGKEADGKYRYCAVLLRNDYDYPHIIPLFTEDKLKDLDDFYESDELYDLVWKPLESELKGVRNIYFAADRDLHKIGIEYAPISGKENIGDRYNLYRVSSTRVLAENRTDRKDSNAVLYGGLRYDLDKDRLIAESRSGEYHPLAASRSAASEDLRYGVKYLPGTLKEVEGIAEYFSDKPRVITDISGTEESFKALNGSSVDIIHLATHGFFWNEEDAKKRDYVSFLKQNPDLQSSEEDKALTRSGLFFSGANIGLQGETLPDDVEDGVLTALELSNMNLGNVDMVVMSACESGLGETSGEGVFGLQRGFKLAGALTLLMSLWKVDDAATQLLMTEFYKNYLTGKTKQKSLRLAQKTLRNTKEYSDPQYWAAFILLDGLN